ncbi:MAG: sulfatase, partial [Planctomycetota bacterium]
SSRAAMPTLQMPPMRRLSAFACLLVGALLAACAEPPPAVLEDGRPPSVILISLDTVRADHLGLYGQPRPLTPNLDAFHEEEGAILYERAFSTGAWTLSAHMSMFTGLYPREHGVNEANRGLSEQIPTLAERLSERGYATYAVHAGGWIHERHGFARGFDVFLVHEDAEEALDNLAEVLADHEATRPDDPIFLFLHLFDAHSAEISGPDVLFYDPPEPWRGRFAPGADGMLTARRSLEFLAGKSSPTLYERKALEALYAAGVAYVDDAFRRMREQFVEYGLLDRAVTIVTADHGEVSGMRFSKYRGHGDLYQAGLAIPLLMRLPPSLADRAPGANVVGRPVSLVDLAPTIAELTGGKSERFWSGKSLLDPDQEPSEGEFQYPRVIASSLHSASSLMRYPYKFIEHRGNPHVFLYNIHDDPEEFFRIKQQAQIDGRVAPIRRAWDSHVQRRGEVPGESTFVTAMDEDERKQLAALGYADAVNEVSEETAREDDSEPAGGPAAGPGPGADQR